MRKLILYVSLALIVATAALAIDRDAATIESLIVEVANYDDIDIITAAAWSEIALDTIHEEWAILVGLKFGQASADNGADENTWYVGGGIKYYATDFTSFSLLGSYQDIGSGYDFDMITAEFSAKHRLISAEDTISPFVVGGAAIQGVQGTSQTGLSDDFTHFIVTAEVGCDLMLHKTLAIALQAGFSLSESFDGGGHDQHADGWLGSVGMVYYWE